MKNNKTALIIPIAALLVFILASCTFPSFQGGENGEKTTTSAGYNSTVTGESTEASSEKTEETEEPTSAENKPEIEKESTKEVLRKIESYPMGTAGSVQKGTDAAISLLNLSTYADTEGVKSDYADFFENLSDNEKEDYIQNLSEINYIAKSILSGNTDYASYVEESSVVSDPELYTLEKYEEIYSIISES